MFDEPNETPQESALNPADRAKEKADEFRTHAQLAAVFEGVRKFDAQLLPEFDPELAREIQRAMGRLEKLKLAETPVLSAPAETEARMLLNIPSAQSVSTNDYHIHRRPGEVMIVRWLEGDQVETFYQRLQAHFDAAINQFRDEERSANEWKQKTSTLAFLDALDSIEIKMGDRYLRDTIREHRIIVLSTQSADEMNVAHLCDYVMGVPAIDVVGAASAPPDDPTEQDLAWYFKLYSLRGIIAEVERMCFFAYLQKTDEAGDDGW